MDKNIEKVINQNIPNNQVNQNNSFDLIYKEYKDLADYIKHYENEADYTDKDIYYAGLSYHAACFTFNSIKKTLYPRDSHFNFSNLKRIYLNLHSKPGVSRVDLYSLSYIISLAPKTAKLFILINSKDVCSLKPFVRCGLSFVTDTIKNTHIIALDNNVSGVQIIQNDRILSMHNNSHNGNENIELSFDVNGNTKIIPLDNFFAKENRVNLNYSQMQYYSRINIVSNELGPNSKTIEPRLPFVLNDLGIKLIGHNSDYHQVLTTKPDEKAIDLSQNALAIQFKSLDLNGKMQMMLDAKIDLDLNEI